MKREGKALFTLFLFIVDSLAILLTFQTAFWLRIELNQFLSHTLDFKNIYSLFPPWYIALPGWLVIFGWLRLYSIHNSFEFNKLIFSTVKGVTVSTLFLIVISFIAKEDYSRSLILMVWPVGILTISTLRFLFFLLLARLRHEGLLSERISIIGHNGEAEGIADKIKDLNGFGGHFCGYINSGHSTYPHSKVLGDVTNLGEVLSQHKIDRVILCDHSIPREDLLNLAETCGNMGIYLDVIPDLPQLLSNRDVSSYIDNMPLIGLRRRTLSRWDLMLKRSVDFILILTTGILVIPILLIVAILIRLDSPGPILYKHLRLGKGGRHFTFYKFRSMFKDADKRQEELGKSYKVNPFLFKIKNDPRITRAGRILRKFSIDELPQLWNVLKGDMTLVGPRPLPVVDLKEIEESIRYKYWFERRLDVLPGITGLWQIRGRSDLSFDEMVKLDTYYTENWSPGFDFEIFLKTIPVVLSGRGAY